MDNRITQALQVKAFLFLWLAEIFSQIASNMMNFILILVAYSLTNSSTAVSGIVLSFTIPAIIFGLIAGVYVDRWDKKKVLFITNAIRAILLVILTLFHNNLAALYTISFAIAISSQFFIPAETPIIPLIVKPEMLFSANALFGIALYGSILIAYALSGPFLILFGSQFAFFTLALFFVCAAVFIWLMKTASFHKKTTVRSLEKSLISEVKEAITIILRTKDVYSSFILLIILQILILMISVIGPSYARTILGISVNSFPLLFVTPASIGMVIGAILLTTYLHRFPKQKSATIGLFVCGIALLLLPYSSKVASKHFVHIINHYLPHILTINIIHIMIAIAFIMGLAFAFIFVPANTIIQEKTSDESRGKIYGALNTIVAICSLFPVAMAGPIADIFGVSSVLTGIGVVVLIIAGARLFFD